MAEEECDEAENGVTHLSHLELYIQGMEQAGANTVPIKTFLKALEDINTEVRFEDWLAKTLDDCGAPKLAAEHVKKTMKLALNGDICEVASVFTFGREDIIPKVFIKILNNNAIDDKRLSTFKYYLERHIELDGKDHAPLAIALVNGVCEDDVTKWKKAEDAVKMALRARSDLWRAVESQI